MKSVRIIISGRVQGVGYRAWTAKTAQTFNLSGWVRNRADGSVEAVFIGERQAVEEMLEACKNGPMLARVEKIDYFEYEVTTTSEEFSVLPTY